MFISKLKVFHFDKIFTLLKISCNIFKSISLIYLFIFFLQGKQSIFDQSSITLQE